MKDFNNPFDITKASDFSDLQIFNFWIEYPGFLELVSPNSPMSRFILGGKGSGKTHILRYFSINIQRLKYESKNLSLLDGIQKDKFIGCYLNCESLNTSRFAGKNLTNEQWAIIFSIYVELWISKSLLSIMATIKSTSDFVKLIEKEIIVKIIKLFNSDETLNDTSSFETLIDYISNLQKKLDIAVMRVTFETGVDLDESLIGITPGSLIFSIPKIIANAIPEFKDIIFLIILDEFENFAEEQQIYINTLIREKKNPVSFRIGGRLYGIKSQLTLIESEENKRGSEYDIKFIDEIARSNLSEFSKFLKQIFLKRINIFSSVIPEKNINIEASFDTTTYSGDLNSFSLSGKPYLNKLTTALHSFKEFNHNLNDQDIVQIIENIICDSNKIIERLNVFFLYQDIKNKRDLINSSFEIAKDAREFLDHQAKNRLSKKLKRAKRDILAKLFKEFQSFQRYSGLTNFISMSEGLPRNFLILLKNIYSQAIFNSEKPFYNNIPITEESQWKGVMQTSEWFFEDARDPRPNGQKIRKVVSNLGMLFKLYRYSDSGNIDSCKSFRLDGEINGEYIKIIDAAVSWSLLLKFPLTIKSKNIKSTEFKYELNGLIAPLWDLSVQSGGSLILKNDDCEKIFNDDSKEFQKYLKKKEKDLNFPFLNEKVRTDSNDPYLSLF